MWAPQFNTRFLMAMTGGVAVIAWVGNMAFREATWAQTLVFLAGVLCFLMLQLGLLFLVAVVASGGWRTLLRESQPSEIVSRLEPPSTPPPAQSEDPR